MIDRVYIVWADWDPEAEVWVAHSDDVPGLATGADTFEELVDKVKVMVPELLEENGLIPPDKSGAELPISVMARRVERVRTPAA